MACVSNIRIELISQLNVNQQEEEKDRQTLLLPYTPSLFHRNDKGTTRMMVHLIDGSP